MPSSPAYRLVFFVTLLGGFVGCVTFRPAQRTDPPMSLYVDELEMKAEVLRHLQIGTPVGEARKIMESHGFACHFDHARWEEISATADPATKGEVYLVCSRSFPHTDWLARLFIDESVTVYLRLQDGKVAAVRVSYQQACL